MNRAGLRLVLLAITVGSAWLFVAHPWWFPPAASAGADRLDHQFHLAFLVLGILFLAGQIVLVVVIGQVGKDNSAKRNWRGNWRLETAWTLVIIAIFFAFNISGGRLWSDMIHHAHQHDALQVEVTGAQFQWYFRYPGPDGKFGRLDPVKFARAYEGNPLGLDPGDLTGRDDIVTTVLVLPAGRDVELTLRAQDVIHSVFIPDMRFKQDAVPGMEIHAHITPQRIGSYEMVCSQLCGLGHYRMRAVVRIVSPKEFDQWLESQTKSTTAA